MGKITSYAEFAFRRMKKIIESVQTTPNQRAVETKLKQDGYIFQRTTPAGSLLYKRKDDDSVSLAIIDKDGDTSFQRYDEADL